MHGAKRRRVDVVVAGYLGVDLTPQFRATRGKADWIKPGSLTETNGLRTSLSGAVGNTGLALQRLGSSVRLVARIGRDPLGEIAVGLFHKYRLRTEGLRRDGRTAYGIVIAPPGRDRLFLEDPGANAAFAACDVRGALLANCRLLHFGYPPLMRHMSQNDGAECRSLFKRARRDGVAVSLDLSLPDLFGATGDVDWTRFLNNVLPFVDIFTPSLDELVFMMRPRLYRRLIAKFGSSALPDRLDIGDLDRMIDEIKSLGVSIVMVKMAHRGAYLRTGEIRQLVATTSIRVPIQNWTNRTLRAEPFPVDQQRFRNASGAGDCAIAGLLRSIVTGKTFEASARAAMKAGRDSLYGDDATSGLAASRRVGARRTG